MSIEIKNLNFIYDAESPFASHALENVSLNVSDGEFLCIIGHTGSGKSTLVQHLNGITKPSSCDVLNVEGIDLLTKKPDYKSLRQRVGMVFQYPEYQLFEETVKKDIAFGPKNMGLSDGEIDERVEESMLLTGLDPSLRDISPFELSGGQKRRAAIAGVISMRPKVLVLDEPIAGLDPKGKREILEVIKKYKEKYNATVIMISHNMDDIAEIASRVIVMHKGKKALDGTPESVFSDFNKISELGLELPTVSALIKSLNEKDKRIPTNICKINDLIKYVTGVKK
jgi:energy-coupling factor transport system ATP-binding protein